MIWNLAISKYRKIDERAVIMRYGGLAKVGSTVWMAGVAPTGYL